MDTSYLMNTRLRCKCLVSKGLSTQKCWKKNVSLFYSRRTEKSSLKTKKYYDFVTKGVGRNVEEQLMVIVAYGDNCDSILNRY